MADILISKFTTQIPRVGATPATPGFAESEGQDPVAPSGTPQVYTPVTIGSPANGLSISGTQVLTIGLASTSTTGALSSTDWNTFNGKIGGTIASGQVAFGTGVNTVGGSAGLTWDNTNRQLALSRDGANVSISLVRTGSLAGTASINIAGTGVLELRPATSANLNIIHGGVSPVTSVFSGLGRLGVATANPTDVLDVNGTARIRTISNLGTAATSVLVPSATGVVSLRTLAEFASDAGLTNFWTLVGSDIYRNSRIRVGSTSAPNERIDLDSDGGWIRVSNGDRTGGILLGGGIIFPYTTANAASRSWSIASDNGTAYGQFVIRRSATAAGDPKLGTVSLVIDNVGSVGINGVPFSFGNFTYLDVYGRATTHSGVLRLLSSSAANGFQAYVLNGVCISQTIGAVPWTFGVNSGEQFRITASGNILFNTTTDLGFKHYFAGTTAFQGLVTFQENVVTNIAFGTVTGTKIGTATNQRLAFWNKTPIVQPTNAIGAGAFVANTSGIANDTATYGGYTLGQIAQALINVGILA